MTIRRISLVMVGYSFFDSGEHRQKAHIAVHIPVQVAMNNIVATLSKYSEHRPQVLQGVMYLVGNLDAVDSGLVKAFQNLRIRFVLVQQIKMDIAHTRAIVQNHLFRTAAHNPMQHLTNAYVIILRHISAFHLPMTGFVGANSFDE